MDIDAFNQSLNSQMTTALFEHLDQASKKNITCNLLDHFIQLIMDETLKPGYVFPNENEMCRQLRIARSSLREVYAALSAMGFISRSKAGTYVNSTRQIASSIPLRYLLRHSSWNEVMEFRVMVESQTAALAARYADEVSIREMENIIEQMKIADSDPRKLTALDINFHMSIATASNNLLLKNTLAAITTELERSGYSGFSIDPGTTVTNSISFHQQILQAIREHDQKLAKKNMTNHIQDIYTVLAKNIYE